ncbi:MAG: hypothetical protein K8I29_02570 [Alphaproteobacteria bacterium]|uniref:Lipoprotein n=1 Tax=Candidatus Nitrobium versatile TaxID=2884831 RepID=A0A953J5M8_9BACT|nr:hypothetical protein [Candidatus Nitrobium versatile]
MRCVKGCSITGGIVAFGLLLLSSCAGGNYLRTEEVVRVDDTATYTLILYGGRYSLDLENVALLDREGDGYAFEIYAPEFDYRVIRGLPAREALAAAEKHAAHHHAFWRSFLSRIPGPGGQILGYEISPRYYPFETGYPDVLEISYHLQDNRVIVRIQLKPEVERRLTDEESPFIFRQLMR